LPGREGDHYIEGRVLPILRMNRAIFPLPVCHRVVHTDNFFTITILWTWWETAQKTTPTSVQTWTLPFGGEVEEKEDVEVDNHEDENGKELEAIEYDEEKDRERLWQR